MKSAPKVSIILTSFNHAKYLREAIDSALNQTFDNFELIIWDDASTDESWEIIQRYSDPRIKAFRNEVQMRGVYGINKAISEMATGEYIAIHHSDDVWAPEKLATQVTFLNANPRIAAVFTNAQAIDEDSVPLLDKSNFYYSIFHQENYSRHIWLRRFFEKGNALCHPSVLIRKQSYNDCGLYRYGFAQLGDLDMWIRLCLKHEIHVLSEKLVGFRVRENAANSSGNRPETRSRERFEYSILLSNYLQITSEDDLLKVFPEARKYYHKNEATIHYALARAMLDTRTYDFIVPFALTIIFEYLNDPKNYGYLSFEVNEFIKLTGDLDPLHVIAKERHNEIIIARDDQIANLSQAIDERDRQITNLNRAISERDSQISNLQQTIVTIMASRSWQITRLLRWLGRLVRGKS